ncbi:MAG: exodeoxyribonuclease VII small subunit [Acidobacteriota bacterium]
MKKKKVKPEHGAAISKMTFEEALARLEEIVNGLESGEISLEESLKLFEEGIVLSRHCNEKLKEARQKVEILVKSSTGEIIPQPFEPSDESE